VLQVSTHGSLDDHTVWKYPYLTGLATLTGSLSSVFYMALSPDGETILTSGGDQIVRFWNIFSGVHSQKVNAQFIYWKKYFLINHICTCRNL
jgi:cell division cycle 20-like protein 1 (cofactor of APC complex)